MGRWQPGTRERLQATALQLFASQGYDQTTVAEIAAAAEVTERTFFRHFTDKREVLFAGQDDFVGVFTGPIEAAPAEAPPFGLVRVALESAGGFFPEERRAWSRARQGIIDANPALGERELGKLASLKVRLGEVFRDRGVAEPVATITAETAVTVFHLSFAQWITAGEDRPFSTIARERLDALTELVHPGR
ncbi:transcriptional regulator, TetR family [Curtobacterium sp. UNCCL20]|uniref:TetR/AcrR family transcriptional regulator n=1 Tax=Curtobacterium sp. UNCCL20 TaxID=1502773 RepID=UPI0008894273|nr:TetR/AcrR family transcriptional regulator [Curtobacterium sp. UNCCL20]SDQ60743.1 transcriptional regulator, TetR family [Curtobacterium sp. UNCCL20]